ncbi:MAG: 3-dehydroquinate synthase [Nanoarchaeota archaeon]
MTYVFGVCLKAEDNPFWSVEIRNGIESAIATHTDVRIICKSPDRIRNIAQQKRILGEFIRKGVDGIILAPCDPKVLIPTVKEVNQNNIPLVVIDSRLNPEEVKKESLSFTFLGFDDFKGGFETGNLLKSKLPKGSPVAIIQGYPKGSYTRRVDGFEYATKGHFIIKKVISADFEEELAYIKTKSLINDSPKIRAIFCTSDNMAMGSLTALYELGREDILVCGFDATHAGRLAVERGKLLSTVNTHPEDLGRNAVEMLYAIKKGLATEKDIEYPLDLLTRERVQKYPKQVIQVRKYHIVSASVNCSECAYENLTNTTECPIVFGKNILVELPARLKKLSADKFYLITDSIVKDIYGDKLARAIIDENLSCELLSFPAGEPSKTFTTLNLLATRILSLGLTKKTVLVLLGGGVVGNLAGMLASLLMRGVRFVHVPTTIMAQADSTTGGKQAVNTEHGKNLLGTFYEPEFIYIDPILVTTLSKREYASGMAEIIKHGLCQSKKLLDMMEKSTYESVLKETIRLKTAIIESDPRERRQGMILVYGHTIGHALETVSHHRLTHGEAISIGMVAASRISYHLGFCDRRLIEKHEQILKKHNLPIRIPQGLQNKDLLQVLYYDKKERVEEIPFVLLEEIGKVKMQDDRWTVEVPKIIISDVIKEIKKH